MKKAEAVSVVIRRIELNDVELDGLTPFDVINLARNVESKMSEISKEKKIVDTFKLALYAALYYAAKAQLNDNSQAQESADGEKQIESAIEKLQLTLSRLPMK